MFKIKLDKELKGLKSQREAEIASDKAVKEVKLLVESNEVEERRILNKMATGSASVQAEQKLGNQIELEKLEDRFEGNIFTRADIQKLAVRYRLRFLRSTRFKGVIAREAITALKKTNDLVHKDDHTLGSKYYILAPASEFYLDKDTSLSPMRKFMNKIEKALNPPDLDPVLFYEISHDEYKMIYKWGTDFTILRRILGMILKNRLSLAATLIPIGLLMSVFIWGSMFFAKPIVSTIVVLVTTLLIISYPVFSTKRMFFSEDNWDMDQKV